MILSGVLADKSLFKTFFYGISLISLVLGIIEYLFSRFPTPAYNSASSVFCWLKKSLSMNTESYFYLGAKSQVIYSMAYTEEFQPLLNRMAHCQQSCND